MGRDELKRGPGSAVRILMGVTAVALAYHLGAAANAGAQVTGPEIASAAELRAEIERSGSGTLSFTYATRDGVEGCRGRGWKIGGSHHYESSGGWDRDDECHPGPAEVELTIRAGEVERIDLDIAPESPAEVDRALGTVAPQAAAEVLIDLAEDVPGRSSRRALTAAFVARDVEVWPRFVQIARDHSRESGLRKQAMFWLGQEATIQVVGPLEEIARASDEGDDVREAAVFALSQRPDDESIPVLMELARELDDPGVQRSAFFWLAQKDDERVLEFFERILTSG
jgi:hypothetical protein